MRKVDLHIHTYCSDGVLKPGKILELAQEYEYHTISITDHDTIAGYCEAKQLMSDYDFNLVPGVEVSCIYEGRDIHILAYNFDTGDRRLLKTLDYIHKGRISRAVKILEKLENLGIKLDFGNILKQTGKNELIARPHIAKEMIRKKICSSLKEAFDYYLGENCLAYVPKPAPSAKKAIKQIKNAGGVSVLAHPFTLNDDSIIFDLIDLGVKGLEVYYPKHSQEQIDFYSELAMKNNLIRTGGSDFHGNNFDIFGLFTAPSFVVDELKDGKIKWKT